MKPLKKFTALAVILIGIFSFSKKETKSLESSLNLEKINIVEVLSKQQFECRPSSDFMFYVETNLVKKIRGANNINAKVYILDKTTGKKNLLAQENIQINKFEGSIAIKDHNATNVFKNSILENGDKIIGGSEKAPYAFDELVKYEAIYNGYINATNKLLRLKRSI
jgi:hypothetical protein